jgi:predicted RNase H-like HicB family nuclease
MAFESYTITIRHEGEQYYAYSDDFPGVYGPGKTVTAAKWSILRAMRLHAQHSARKP